MSHDLTPPNPSGLCMCGCGEKTPIATRNRYRIGQKQGHPIRFISGHNAEPRVLSADDYVVTDLGFKTPCHIWKFSIMRGNGYGQVTLRGINTLAHRAFWIKLKGPIPDGLVIDHLCCNKACVNTDHMEVVEHGENTRRGVLRRQGKMV